DPHELTNLAGDERYAPLLRAMRAALDDWTARTGDVKPARRTPDEFDRLTGLPTPARVRPRPSKLEMAEAAAKEKEKEKEKEKNNKPSAPPSPPVPSAKIR